MLFAMQTMSFAMYNRLSAARDATLRPASVPFHVVCHAAGVVCNVPMRGKAA
jgi:hypothetical protein